MRSLGTRRHAAVTALVLPAIALPMLLAGGVAVSARPAAKPNIVLVLTDDLDARAIEQNRDRFTPVRTALPHPVSTSPKENPGPAAPAPGLFSAGSRDHRAAESPPRRSVEKGARSGSPAP